MQSYLGVFRSPSKVTDLQSFNAKAGVPLKGATLEPDDPGSIHAGGKLFQRILLRKNHGTSSQSEKLTGFVDSQLLMSPGAYLLNCRHFLLLRLWRLLQFHGLFLHNRHILCLVRELLAWSRLQTTDNASFRRGEGRVSFVHESLRLQDGSLFGQDARVVKVELELLIGRLFLRIVEPAAAVFVIVGLN